MLKWLLGIGLLACVWSAPALATCGGTCFVVAAGGSASVNTTWATSSGGTTCTCLPAATDAIILDSLAGNLTLNTNTAVTSLDASGTGGSGSPYTGTLTHQNSTTLTINTAGTNALKFSSQMTYTPGSTTSALVTFTHTSGTATITSAGKNFNAITLNGVGGTVSQADNLSITNIQNAILTITNGTWTSNGFTLTAGLISSNNSNTRGFVMGTNTILGGNVAGNQTIWGFSTTTGLTFTPGPIEVAVPSAANSGWIFAGGGLTTYTTLTLDASTVRGGVSVTGNNTFTSLTIGSGWVLQFPATGTNTLSGTLTETGTSANWSGLASALTSISTLTITGACTLTYTIVQNITFTNPCTATNSIAMGVDTNATITAPSSGSGGYIIGN